jgi:hypothetical protein
MSGAQKVVGLEIVGGSSVSVPWKHGMNAQQVLEVAFNSLRGTGELSYALQYFGDPLGYLVVMINETYESFMSSTHPFFFWEFLVNGVASPTGIDGTILHAGDMVTFELQTYDAVTHAGSTLKAKFESRLRATAGAPLP